MGFRKAGLATMEWMVLPLAFAILSAADWPLRGRANAERNLSNEDVVLRLVLRPGDEPSTVRLRLHENWAPLGVARFQQLVSMHWFTNAAVYRVEPHIRVQFGWPAVPREDLLAIRDDPVTVSNRRGTLVFAQTGTNTRTTQLFINLLDHPFLDRHGNAPIGEVVEGMDIVDRINDECEDKANQSLIQAYGNVYLDREFPNLTKIYSLAYAAVDAAGNMSTSLAPRMFTNQSVATYANPSVIMPSNISTDAASNVSTSLAPREFTAEGAATSANASAVMFPNASADTTPKFDGNATTNISMNTSNVYGNATTNISMNTSNVSSEVAPSPTRSQRAADYWSDIAGFLVVAAVCSVAYIYRNELCKLLGLPGRTLPDLVDANDLALSGDWLVQTEPDPDDVTVGGPLQGRSVDQGWLGGAPSQSTDYYSLSTPR